jgi:hypothetical protein
MLAGRGRVDVVAYPGVRMDQFQDQVEGAVGRDPDAVVILLGANNVNQGGWTAGDEAQLDRMLAAVGRARCVRWINASTTTGLADYDAAAVAFNRSLARNAARYPRVRVVDWASRIAADPGWLIPGDIHLTATGREAMARTIATAAEDCLAGRSGRQLRRLAAQRCATAGRGPWGGLRVAQGHTRWRRGPGSRTIRP